MLNIIYVSLVLLVSYAMNLFLKKNIVLQLRTKETIHMGNYPQNFRPVYTYRHRRFVRVRHRQSLTLHQWKRTVSWPDWVQNPFPLSNGPSPLAQCKFNGYGECDGTCKQGLGRSKRSFHVSWEIFDILQ